jgi:ABC-type oligopeptide transport system substrate-binding subunit
MTNRLMQLCGLALALSLSVSAAFAGERYENIHIANGLASAAIGDWVLVRLPDGKTQKHTVMERNGEGKEATATVQIVDFQGNVPTFSKKQTFPAGEEFMQPPAPDGKKYTYGRRKETVDFEGTELEVTIVDVYADNRKIRTWYLSTEFPVYGAMKRLNANDEAEFSLVTFGTGGAGETDPYIFPAAK